MSILVASNTRFRRRVRPNPLLYPSGSWNGTAGTGGTAPAESTSVLGTGWTGKAIGRFDEPTVTYMTDDFALTVGADHGDSSWISSVEFWCEGRSVTVSSVSKSSRTGAIGFVCTLDNSAFSSDGDAQVYAYIRPVNGYERRIGPITITRIQDSSRPARYVSTSGSDSNNGAVATPWRSLVKAMVSAPSGAIVYLAAGTYNEDSNAGTLNNNTRPIEFRRAPGVAAGAVTVGQSALVANSFWQPRAKNLIFNGLTIDLTNVVEFYGASPSGVYTFKDCTLVDTGGVTSGFDTWPGIGSVQIGRQINTEAKQNPFRIADGQENNLLESSQTLYVTAGWTLARNSTLSCAADAVFISNAPSKVPAIFNVAATQITNDGFEQRRHLAHTLTVASVSYTAGVVNNPDGVSVPGKTTIVWNEATTYDTIATGGQPNQNFRFLSGALAGSQYAIYSQSGSTTVLYGDCRAAVAGDSARGYIIFHADALQLGGQSETDTNVDNLFVQRFRAVGASFQVLWQAGGFTGQGTVTTVGAALTCSTTHRLAVGDFVRPSTGGQTGEWRRVLDVPTTTTATLDAAFTVDQSAVAWRHSKSIRNSAVQLSIIHKTVPSSIIHQWQHGHDHFVWRQNTLVGQTFYFANTLTFLGTSGCLVKDNIIEQIARGDAVTSPPTGVTIDSNQIVQAASQITGSNSTVANPVLDGDYLPTVTIRTTTPKIRFNHLGDAISAGARVGALG